MKRADTLGTMLLVALMIALSLAACGEAKPTPDSVSVEEHFRQGNELAQAGQFEQAITEYQAVLELEADNVSAMTNLGVAYYSIGKLDEAIAQYEKALEIAPDDADIRSNLGAAFVQKGQLDEALEAYQKATELKPDLAEAYFGLGVIYLQTSRTEEAIEAFESFQEYDSGQDTIATEQAEQYLQQLRGQ